MSSELVPIATAAAAYYGRQIPRSTLHRWATKGLQGRTLAAQRIGRRLFTTTAAVAAFAQ
jgi:hypothetical protein